MLPFTESVALRHTPFHLPFPYRNIHIILKGLVGVGPNPETTQDAQVYIQVEETANVFLFRGGTFGLLSTEVASTSGQRLLPFLYILQTLLVIIALKAAGTHHSQGVKFVKCW